MNEVTFLQNFKHVANSPDGVQRLRELVLQLAAMGRLVPRVASEGDAESLVAAISDERERRANEGGVRLASPLLDVDSGSQSVSVPDHWRWIRLGNLTSKIGSGSTPRGGSKVYVSKGVPFLRSQNIWNDGVRLDDVVFISAETHAKMRNTHVVPNDILLNITGASLGRGAIVPVDFPAANVSQHVTIIRPLLTETRHFLHICLLSPFGQAMIWGRQVGMAREGLSKKVLEQFEIPLPPLEEQKRIVAKVDELMRLCDRLEAQQQEREKLLPLLSRANHTRLVTKPSAASLQAIFHQPGAVTVTDLRQTIRDLAIRGRLVDQRPTDTPVETLLEQIVSLKCQSGPTSRRSLRNSTIGLAASAQFDAPDNWRWVFLGDVVINRDGERIPVSKEEREKRKKVYDYYGASGIIDKIDAYLFNKPLLLIGEDGANLINRSTPVAFMARGEYWVNNHAHVLDGISEDFLRYIELFINAINLEAYVTGTAQPKMNQAQMNRIPIALPPLEEQIRILAKVDELMRLCDGLESVSSNRKAVSEAFARSAIAAITSTDFTENQRMKPPKTVVVTALKAGEQPQNATLAPLAALLATEISLAPPKTAASADAKRELTAKELWQLSGLEIDAFYRQLKTEIANGWIEEDKDKRAVNEVEAR